MNTHDEDITSRRPEVLVADIGSTITKLSAFAGLKSSDASDCKQGPSFLGQGMALTTSSEGDVGVGLESARRDLETRFSLRTSGVPLMVASSAAGGLRMTVHGLTRDMTLRAANEASLGAGAIVTFATAGRISCRDLETIRRIDPNLVLLAGGVDYGERDVVVANALQLATLGGSCPVIFAGNKAVIEDVQCIFTSAHVPVFSVDNVYPRIDKLNVEPVRELIQEVFSSHIVTAPGMQKLKATVVGRVAPTPGAVMCATELLAQALGDVMTVDVGGATTDVHSVTEGSPQYRQLSVAPEPRCKRSVEGDLGVYLNASGIVTAAKADLPDIDDLTPIPDSPRRREMSADLTRWAVDISVWRHAGELRASYGTLGRSDIVEGRDLTAIQYVIGTGGALTRLENGREILESIRTDPKNRKLLPPKDAKVLVDRHYIMSAAGVLSQHYPRQALALLLDSVALAIPR